MFHSLVSSLRRSPDQVAGVPRPRAPQSPASAPGAGYTLAHAGRQLRVGPIAFWVVVGTLVIMATWTITTATYFAFREDVLTRLVSRQAEMQYAYEDRIAELRAQIDRISSRQLLNQEQYEQRLEEMIRRQASLESRSNALNAMPDALITGSTRAVGRDSLRSAPSRPSPVHDKSSSLLPPREALPRDATVANTLARLQTSLDRVEARQTAALASMEENYENKSRRIRGVLGELGLNPAHIGTANESGIGGPLVPVRLPNNAGGFERQVYRVSVARAQADRLTRALAAIPVRKPIQGDMDLSSGFGVRMDPFIRAPAMHTGLDFRGEVGDPVRTTANGTITMAGWSGGYGKMVEVDHGNGLRTRYGHLSHIDVTVGQRVRAGGLVGRLGTTGRSTGPHVHYETRVNGEAVDPIRFLRAGTRLGSVN